MRAFVRLRLHSDERELGHGDVIGRSWTAAFPIADPFVSEAHALVSLREGGLKLLGLRGRLIVGGKAVPEVLLSVGLKVGLSQKTVLEVTDLRVPTTLLALDHPSFGRRILTGVVSVVTTPRLDLIPGANPDAQAILWSDGLAWFLRLPEGTQGFTDGAADRPLEPGGAFDLGGNTLHVVAVAIGTSGEITTVDPRSLDRSLHLTVRYDTVHIHRDGAPTLVIDGIAARIVSDLATAGVPMGWQTMAHDLWKGESDFAILRRNWDAALARLRKKLREAHIRTDLVRADRSGNFEIFLMRGDQVDDQT